MTTQAWTDMRRRRTLDCGEVIARVARISIWHSAMAEAVRIYASLLDLMSPVQGLEMYAPRCVMDTRPSHDVLRVCVYVHGPPCCNNSGSCRLRQLPSPAAAFSVAVAFSDLDDDPTRRSSLTDWQMERSVEPRRGRLQKALQGRRVRLRLHC
jgi:hypothetical protein